jgi:hypothetical protein
MASSSLAIIISKNVLCADFCFSWTTSLLPKKEN